MGLIKILRHPKWWWKHKGYSLRGVRTGRYIQIENTEHYDNGNKRYHYAHYIDYKDPKTGYEFSNRWLGGSKTIWADDPVSIEDKFDMEVRREDED